MDEFQSPRCRGASSDELINFAMQNLPESFNPLDAGALLQTRVPAALLPEVEAVSIPSMPGRFFRRASGVYRSRLNQVSIPSMPGRFFRLGGSVSPLRGRPRFNPLDAGALLQTFSRLLRIACLLTGFNPLDAGALLQTYTPTQVEAMKAEFQSPRCRGASSDPAFLWGMPAP